MDYELMSEAEYETWLRDQLAYTQLRLNAAIADNNMLRDALIAERRLRLVPAVVAMKNTMPARALRPGDGIWRG